MAFRPPPSSLLLLLLLVPSDISSTLLESADPATGEATRWEGWVSVVRGSGLPEGARVSLVDSLGRELPGSSDVVEDGRANLSVVSKFPGVLRLAVNGTPTGETLLLNGSFDAEPPLFFGRARSPLWAELCVLAVRNSAGARIPDVARDGVPVSLGETGARTDGSGCALLPAPRDGPERARFSGLPGPDVPVPAVPDGVRFSFVEGGGSATEFFERGPLRWVQVSASRDIANFTLVVEPLADNSLLLWSRRSADGPDRILLGLAGEGAPHYCPQRQPANCMWTPLPAAPSQESIVAAPLPGFGIIRMDTTNPTTYPTEAIVILMGVAISFVIFLAALRRKG